MIARMHPGGLSLGDRELLAALLTRPEATIRAHCQPIACDIKTRRVLYDTVAAAAALADIGRRQHRRLHDLLR